MGLLSFFKRSAADSPKAVSAPETVEQARVRARHRLIGAAVLVGIAVIGFPIIFETQPRPIPVDLPIEIPQRDGAAPLALPAPAPARSSGGPVIIEESPADAGREVATAPVTPPVEVPAPPQPETVRPQPRQPEPAPPAPRAESRPQAPAAAATPAKPAAPARSSATEAARAQALLEGRDAPPSTAAAPAGSRFVVQVGAYSETGSARDVRQKVEKIGLKTYTQVVETSNGKRIRVRVGPYASREEAERALAKLKAAGLPGAVLTL